ncbi:hypothetical protein NSQ43_03140 [Sporosarcina sp. FSL W8-0480]|uniref:hypothetical protein n=1 Tax=Sporosarcina sp. FSL W8-0480 TaxID=2954701 RepID=UPI0030DD2EAB
MESAGILAGPNLRRVGTGSVAECAAVGRPVEMDSAIYRLDNVFPLRTTTTSKIMKAGHRTFIYLLRVHGQFPMDTFVGYDLLFHNGKRIYNAADFGLKANIPIEGLPRSTFFIPASAAPTFQYASCRNSH